MHAIFDRYAQRLTVFDLGVERFRTRACAATIAPPDESEATRYGVGQPMAPGHYEISRADLLRRATPNDGSACVTIIDLRPISATTLKATGRAHDDGRGQIAIGGIVAAVGGLARFGRTAVTMHGGGASLGIPECFAERQPLTPTRGGIRLHNGAIETFVRLIRPRLRVGVVCVLTVFGEPSPCDS